MLMLNTFRFHYAIFFVIRLPTKALYLDIILKQTLVLIDLFRSESAKPLRDRPSTHRSSGAFCNPIVNNGLCSEGTIKDCFRLQRRKCARSTSPLGAGAGARLAGTPTLQTGSPILPSLCGDSYRPAPAPLGNGLQGSLIRPETPQASASRAARWKWTLRRRRSRFRSRPCRPAPP